MSVDLVRSTTNIAKTNSWHKFGLHWRLPRDVTTGTKQSYLILATVLGLKSRVQTKLYYLWNTTKCQTAGYDIPFIQSIIFFHPDAKWNPIQCGSVLSQLADRGDQYHWMWMLVDPSFHSGDSVWICALHMGQVFSLSNHMETQFSQNICWNQN